MHTLRRDNTGDHLLAAQVVGHRSDPDLRNGRMLEQHGLHLERRDVLAAPADHVLLAVDKEITAVRPAARNVARVPPATVPAFSRRRLVLEVAREETAAGVRAHRAHKDLAWFPIRHRVAIVVAEPQFDFRRRAPETALTHMPWLVVRTADSAGAGLGHGPSLDQRKPESRLERRMVLGLDVGARPVQHAMRAFLGHDRQFEQDRRHHAKVMHTSGARGRNILPPCFRMEAVELDYAAARHDHAKRAAGHGVHVKHRQRRKHARSTGHDLYVPAPIHVAPAGTQVILVGEQAPLGLAGRARGIEQAAFGREPGHAGRGG